MGTNSVTINTTDNTNLTGALIANIKEDGTDGGNLALNTGSLTYLDLYDYDVARSIGVAASYSDKPATNNPGQATTAKTQGSGNASFSLDYSSHDIEQTTRATVGLGAITIAGTDTSMAEGSSLISGLNRDINKSQEVTKYQNVDPINFSASVSWDNKVDTNGNEVGGFNNPFTAKLNEWKSLLANPLDPMRRNFQGVTRDISVIAGDMQGIDPGEVKIQLWPQNNSYFSVSLKDEMQRDEVNKALKDAEKNKDLVTVLRNSDGETELGIGLQKDGDKDNIEYYQQRYTLNTQSIDQISVQQNPSLLLGITDFFRNGIMNNESEATKNAIKQLGGFDESNKLVVMYDPSFKNITQPLMASLIGEGKISQYAGSVLALPVDVLEVNINYLGNGVIMTGGAIQDQAFADAVLQNATAQNPLFFADHSAGGARQYVNLLNSALNQFKDANGNSLIYVQLNGAPVYSPDAQSAADNNGAVYLGNTVNGGDFVGNGLGANNGWVQFLGSTLLSYKLFDEDSSPHSSYYCQGSLCNYNQSATLGQTP